MSPPIESRKPRAARTYDLVLWGATGFTGKLVAEYLTRTVGVGGDVTWALAGRNRAKLEEVRAALVPLDVRAAKLPLLTGDAADRASLTGVVADARVVITTVGPYALYGRELVAACVDHGTDYVDLTGETQFVRAMIDLHHERARQTGARIVNCCGFDSIPSDLGVLLLQDEMRKQHGGPADEIKFFVASMKGGVSGGTIASMMNIISDATRDPELRRLLGDPYALNPDRDRDRGPDHGDQRGPRYDADIDGWTGPFVMAAINTRVVRRSNALLGWAYGRDFRYSEVWRFGRGPGAMMKATGLSAGLGAFTVAAAMGPTRRLLEKRLPSAGEGPSKEQREGGGFTVKLVGKRDGQARLVATVRGQQDPGYGETAKMLSEAGLCLARDNVAVGGGVLTPASSRGLALVDRLRRAGMTFDVEPSR